MLLFKMESNTFGNNLLIIKDKAIISIYVCKSTIYIARQINLKESADSIFIDIINLNETYWGILLCIGVKVFSMIQIVIILLFKDEKAIEIVPCITGL